MGDVVAPARAALRQAGEGDGSDEGFLSESHGLIPSTNPSLAMPASHEAWDQFAASLPRWLRAGSLSRELGRLPTLRADEAHLEPQHLCRAATLLGVMAHADVHAGPGAPHDPCPALLRPWTEVCRRLGRPQPALTFSDVVTCNWKAPGRLPSGTALRLEDLSLLAPISGNEAERVYFLGMLEIVGQCTPIIGAVVRAQEAMIKDDPDGVGRELDVIRAAVESATFTSLAKMNPNPHAATYIDQGVWSATVARFVDSSREGEPAINAAASPMFHVLDAFFGRARFESEPGHEALALARWLSPAHAAFVDAVRAMSVRDYVVRSADTILRGRFQSTLESYAGERGFLGAHRRKMYGFTELAFKVAQGGLAGGRPWDDLDDALERARAERYDGQSIQAHRAVHAGTSPTTDDWSPVTRVRFDLQWTGLRYRPGDRLGVLARNSPTLVDKTLRALRATGEERIALTRAWRDTMQFVTGMPPLDTMPLRTFLEHAKLRPVQRSTARALAELTRLPALHTIVERREEDHWELWDFLELLSAGTYDVRRLWRAEPFAQESLARLVPPERFRMYSISSAPDADLPSRLDLTVKRLAYDDTHGSETVAREGAASRLLSEPDTAGESVPVQILRPSRFHLPADRSRPIVMFAVGTGIAPFRGFLAERKRGRAESWLFFETTTPAALYYRKELEQLVADGDVELRVAFSQADTVGRIDRAGPRLVLEAGPRRTIGALLDDHADKTRLRQLLRPKKEGGEGAYVYICGHTDAAVAVLDALRRVSSRDATEGAKAVRRMAADGRLMMDVFTTLASGNVQGDRAYDASDIVVHNDAIAGQWLVIRGNVYDLTEFLHLHPGGAQILRSSAGTDASRSYEKVQHHAHPDVHAMLDMYRIGRVRRLDFADRWSVAILRDADGAPRVQYVTLHELYRRWIRMTYAVVEAENSLSHELGLQLGALTAGEDPSEASILKLQLALRSHGRVVSVVIPGLLGSMLDDLWAITTGLCAPEQPIGALRSEIGPFPADDVGPRVRALLATLTMPRRELQARDWDVAERVCARCGELDMTLLDALKQVLRQGLRVFERLEADTPREGHALVEALAEIPEIHARYARSIAGLPGGQ